MKTKEDIMHAFGEERAALYDAEVQYLVEKGYVKEDINAFLETYALPMGSFFALSMFTRSKLSVKDMTKSLTFLFNSSTILTESIASHLKPNSKILDFGCGRGLVSCSFALKGFEVYGVDVSKEAIDVAKRLARILSCNPSFHLVEKNELSFSDAYFDVAFSVWTFHEVQQEQLAKIVAELYRVLRKTGRFFMIDQEHVAPFETVKKVMSQVGFRLESEKALSPIYDHGKASQAIMLSYLKE